MKEVIRQLALELGFDDCRFTTAAPPGSGPHYEHWLEAQHQGAMSYLERSRHKRLDPNQVLPGAKSIICLLASYAPNEISHEPAQHRGIGPAGIVARYARHADYHEVIGKRLADLARFLGSVGHAETRSLWYVDTGPVLERDLAQRAGLGFIGKHTNLISRKFGNWIFLAEILTTLELPPDSPQANHCGSCTRCLAACPTAAIRASFCLDARLCISYLTIELKGPIPVELRPAVGNRVFGCDDCLAVCPWNRFARQGRLMRAHAQPGLAALDLLELLSISEAEFRKRFLGTPLFRAKRRGLLRNVCVALGNIGNRSALLDLEKTTQDPEPLIAEHARWAIDQIRTRADAGPQ